MSWVEVALNESVYLSIQEVSDILTLYIYALAFCGYADLSRSYCVGSKSMNRTLDQYCTNDNEGNYKNKSEKDLTLIEHFYVTYTIIYFIIQII